jgi:hypothetical protein
MIETNGNPHALRSSFACRIHAHDPKQSSRVRYPNVAKVGEAAEASFFSLDALPEDITRAKPRRLAEIRRRFRSPGHDQKRQRSCGAA